MGHVISFFAFPRRLAIRLFKPREENRWVAEDSTMMRLGYARSAIGLLIVIAVGLRYQGLHTSQINLGQRIEGLVITTFVVGIESMIIGLGLIAATHRTERLRVARRMVIPARAFLAYLGICFGIYLFAMIWDTLDANPLIGTLLTLAIVPLLLILWCITLASVSSFYCVTYACRGAEGHPVLPPVLTAAAAWTVAVVGPYVLGSDHDPGPAGFFGLLLLIGGPTAVTALSVVEIWRLGYVPGLDLRGGPPAAPLDRDLSARSPAFAGTLPLAATMTIVAAIVAALTMVALHITRLHAI
jgi:hypothetical protein